MNLPTGLVVAVGVGRVVGDSVGVAAGEATGLGETDWLGTAERLADADALGVGLAEFPIQPAAANCVARATPTILSPRD